MLWNDDLTHLQHELARLYDKDSSRSIVREAGIPVESVAFKDKAIDNWSEILVEALRQEKVLKVIRAARRTYENNQVLKNAEEVFEARSQRSSGKNHLAALRVIPSSTSHSEPEALDESAVESSSTSQEAGMETAGSASLYGTGNHWALLIGIKDYEDVGHHGQTRVSANDAEAFHRHLIVTSFDSSRLYILTDERPELPTSENILTRLRSITRAVNDDDLLLFYYSGYGVMNNKGCYLIAHDSRWAALDETAVSLLDLKAVMREARIQAKVIILDICFSENGISGRELKRTSDQFISSVFEHAEGLTILIFCGQKQVDHRSVEEHSIFTHFFLETLVELTENYRKNFVTVREIHSDLAKRFKSATLKKRQMEKFSQYFADAGDVILCRYSYFTTAYNHIAKVQKALERASKLLSITLETPHMKKQGWSSQCQRIIVQLQWLGEPPTPVAEKPPIDEILLAENLNKAQQQIVRLMWSVEELRLTSESPAQSAKIHAKCQEILTGIESFQQEVNEIAQKLQKKIQLTISDIERL